MDGSRQPRLKLQWPLRALSSLAPETAPGRLEAYSGRRGRPGKPGFTPREHPGPWAPAWAGWRAISVIGLVGAPYPRSGQQALLAHTLFIDVSGVYDSAVGVAVCCWVQGEGVAMVFVHVVSVSVGGSVLLLLLSVQCRCTCRVYRGQSYSVACCVVLCAV